MASQAQKASVPQMKFVAPPSYANAEEERAHKLQRLALAFRVFAKLGFDEGVAGHLTLRDPIDTDCFWVNPFGVPFAHMTVSDLLKVDHQGNIVGGGRPDLQLYNRAAFAIHSRIHMARPDVHAACHSHSIHGKAFSTLGRNISIITQDTCALYKNCNLYPNFGGIVLDDEEGDNIARHLGDGKALILQVIYFFPTPCFILTGIRIMGFLPVVRPLKKQQAGSLDWRELVRRNCLQELQENPYSLVTKKLNLRRKRQGLLKEGEEMVEGDMEGVGEIQFEEGDKQVLTDDGDHKSDNQDGEMNSAEEENA
ncbi:arad-like aldolase/epimerase [Atractiella rhizophila]|nr:arad-like aldolase/epimerase [Atractiella rhizophila]